MILKLSARRGGNISPYLARDGTKINKEATETKRDEATTEKVYE
ncbi:MAG: hypothetical protein ACRC0F_03375 [Cetobacterium sp.]